MADGIPYIVANQSGMLALAKLLVTMGAGSHSEGLRLHLREDFDGERDEVLRIRLEQGTPQNGEPRKESGLSAA